MSKTPISYSEHTSKHRHFLRVVRYNETFKCHECITNEGQNVLVDVFIDGTLPKTWDDQNIIGQTVEVAYTHGFVWIASEPRIVEGAA